MSQTYEYSYTGPVSSSVSGLGSSGGYSVEYGQVGGGDVNVSSSGLSSGAAGALLVGSSGASQSSGGGLLIGSSGASGSGSSNATVSQIASDLLAMNAGGSGGAGGISYSSGGGSFASGGGAQFASGGGAQFASGGGAQFASGGGASFAAGGGAVLEASAFSQIEQAILRANNPIDISESEVITINGQSGIWANRAEVINWRGIIPINQYVINEDSNPEIIRKRTEQQIVYEQEVAIRYLRPPTPPPPGEILIKQEKNIPTPPAPPLVIRQQPPRPETPAPMVIREAPPRPPAAIGQKVVTISGKRLPPPPRKVIIERLPPLPSKPQSVIIERWLPYNQQKRKVIFARSNEPDPVIPRPRNVIIQWEAPQVQIKKEFKDLGVIRANPSEYVQRYGASLKTHIELPQFVKEIKPPSGVILAAEYVAPSLFELEGDVQALNLINLDAEGLSEYRAWLSRFASAGGSVSGSSGSYGVSYSGGSSSAVGGGASAGGASAGGASAGGSSAQLNSLLAELFASVDRNQSGRITRSEAEKLLLRLNSRLGRRYGEDEAAIFFRALDVNGDGFIDFEEFRRALLRQF